MFGVFWHCWHCCCCCCTAVRAGNSQCRTRQNWFSKSAIQLVLLVVANNFSNKQKVLINRSVVCTPQLCDNIKKCIELKCNHLLLLLLPVKPVSVLESVFRWNALSLSLFFFWKLVDRKLKTSAKTRALGECLWHGHRADLFTSGEHV